MSITVTADEIESLLHQLNAMRAFRYDIVIEFRQLGGHFNALGKLINPSQEDCVVRIPSGERRDFRAFVDAIAYVKTLFEEQRKQLDTMQEAERARAAVR